MATSRLFTERVRRLLRPLTGPVRAWTDDQVAALEFAATARPRANARRCLQSLVRAELLEAHPLLLYPVPLVTAPLWRWHPGMPPPDTGQLAWQAQRRYRGVEPTPQTVYTATAKTVGLLGGARPRLKGALQLSHDLHVSAIWIHFAQTRPQDLADWAGEDEVRLPGTTKQPDAYLLDADGRPRLAIESAGQYPARRILAFHGFCESHALPYELY